MSNFAREVIFHRGRPSSSLCAFPPDDPLGVTVDDLGQPFDPVDAISIIRSVLQVQNARRNHNCRQAWSLMTEPTEARAAWVKHWWKSLH